MEGFKTREELGADEGGPTKVRQKSLATIHKTAKKKQHKMQHKHMFDCPGTLKNH